MNPSSPEEVRKATEHLREYWLAAKSVRRGSYGLKHYVEMTHNCYCANASLIQAARDLGLRVQMISDFNAYIYVKPCRSAWKAWQQRNRVSRHNAPIA